MKRLTNWFKSLSSDKKVAVIILAGIGLYLPTLVVTGLTQRYLLSQHGVYYAARIHRIASSKNGDHFYIEYQYNNLRYTGSFKPDFDFKPTKEGAFIYIKLMPNNPKMHQYLNEGEVTDSLLKTLPETGWKELPNNY